MEVFCLFVVDYFSVSVQIEEERAPPKDTARSLGRQLNSRA